MYVRSILVTALILSSLLFGMSNVTSFSEVSTIDSIDHIPSMLTSETELERDSNRNSPEIDPILAEWIESTQKPSTLGSDEETKVVILANEQIDILDVESITSLNWKASVNGYQILSISVTESEQLSELVSISGISVILADRQLNDHGTDTKEAERTDIVPIDCTTTDVKASILADGDYASNYSGKGVVVGQVGAGCDFGNPELQHCYHPDSFDASGDGIALTWYTGNATNVIPEEWLADSNHLLTYTQNGDTFLNVTGWDPLLNNGGDGRYLYGDGGPTSPYYSRVGFIWLYAYYWDIDIDETWLESLKQDWKIPSPSQIQGDYHFGYSFQQRNDPYAKIFAPSLVYNGLDSKTHVVINWEDTMGWNKLWTGGFYYESYDLEDDSTTNEIYNEFDWDFTDEFGSNEVFDLDNPILNHDYSENGIPDFSLGALCWVMDESGWFDDEVVYQGFRNDLDAFALLYDEYDHGTMAASIIAASGNYSYYDSVNNQFNISGISPNAKLLSLKGLSYEQLVEGYLWAAGHEYNHSSHQFDYTGSPRVDVLDDSWSYQIVSDSDTAMHYFILDLICSPWSFGDYPGLLVVTSSTTYSGELYSPISNAAALVVGTIQLNEVYGSIYGIPQNKEGIPDSSIVGPTYHGYLKPDLVAPGSGFPACANWHYPLMIPYWEDGFYWQNQKSNYTTPVQSLASSTVAGAAVLVIEALTLNGIDTEPDRVKSFLQCSANDLNLDPSIQGFGKINPNAACEFIETGKGFRVVANDSIDTIETLLSQNLSYHSRYIDDSSIFFGEVTQSQVIETSLSIYPDSSGLRISDFSGWSADAIEFVMSTSKSFSASTYLYNDTETRLTELPGFFNLRNYLGQTEFDALLSSHTSASFYISFEDEMQIDNVYLFDWVDSDPHDGIVNLWNSTTDSGNEVTLVSIDRPNLTTSAIHVYDSSSLSSLIDGNLTLAIDSDLSISFKCSIVFWKTQFVSEISSAFDENSDTLNLTLYVPSEEVAGVHVGQILLSDGETILPVPYSFTVTTALENSSGTKTQLTDINEQEVVPYGGPFGTTSSSRVYPIEVTDDSVNIIGFKISWDQSGAEIGLKLYSESHTLIDSSSTVEGKSTVLVVDIENNGLGKYYLVAKMELAQGIQLPLKYTLFGIWYSDSFVPSINFTYTSSQTLEPESVVDHAIINEDQVVFEASCNESYWLPNLPETQVSSISISVGRGIFFQETAELVIPDSSYDSFGGPIDLSQFAWIYVDGICEGDVVNVVGDFTNGDCDFMAWWADTDNTTWSYSNNLLLDGMATGAHPEVYSFVAERDGTLAVGCFDYDLQPGNWTLTVDTREFYSHWDSGSSVEIPVDYFARNGTFLLNATAYTLSNIQFSSSVEVSVYSYFAPVLSDVVVSGDGAVKTIQWACTDPNVDDEHVYDFYISADDGVTFYLLQAGLLETTYDWDSTGFQEREYIARIVVYDNDPHQNFGGIENGNLWPGLSDSIESEPFPAGTVGSGSGPTTSDLPYPTTSDSTDIFDFNIPLTISFVITGVSIGIIILFSYLIISSRKEGYFD